jgi:cytochrome c5
MNKLTIALAIVAAAALAGCGRNHDAGSASTASNAGSASTATGSSTAGTGSGSMPSTTAQSSPAPGSDGRSTSNTLASGGGSGTASGGATSTTASAAPATGDGTTGASGASTASNTAAMGAGPDPGKATFDQTCQVCHAAGVAGAPKLGDKADWGPRVAQGKNTLYTHALQGFTGKKGMMPPKGGNTALADADVKAAVDYMVAQAK